MTPQGRAPVWKDRIHESYDGDIARMAGVSKATVSRVVNGIEQGVGPETRRRVLQIVKETNYRSYSLPSQNQSKTLGLIIPDIINPFFGELVKAIEGEATEQGYTVLLGNTDSPWKRRSVTSPSSWPSG